MWRSIVTEDINWQAPELRPLSPGARDLLQQLLERDPEVRPSAADALEHPWLGEQSSAVPLRPLKGSVVQRLQRFATYTHLKQVSSALGGCVKNLKIIGYCETQLSLRFFASEVAFQPNALGPLNVCDRRSFAAAIVQFLPCKAPACPHALFIESRDLANCNGSTIE